MNLEEFKKILDDNIDDIVDRIVIRLEKETKESEDFIAPFVGKGVRLINSTFPVFEDQESLVDAISDEYYEYVGSYDYGHPDAEDFMKTIDEFLETEDGIKQFIFSSKQSITCEEYYDG